MRSWQQDEIIFLMIEHTMGSIYCPPTPVVFVNFRPNLEQFIVNNCRIPSELPLIRFNDCIVNGDGSPQ